MNSKVTLFVISLLTFVSLMATSPQVRAQLLTSQFTSTVLNDDVTVQIQLPANYENSKNKYPILYILDGNFFMEQTVAAANFLANPKYMRGLIPQYIVIGLTPQDRDHSFTPTHDAEYEGMAFPTSGSAEEFYQFLSTELFPHISNKYRVTNERILAGWSLGGLFTTWTYLEHPEAFDKYLAISPSFWWDDLVICNSLKKLVADGSLSDRKLTVTLGGLESDPMRSSVKTEFLPLIENQSPNFRYIEIEGEGHNTGPYTSIFKGLRSLHMLDQVPESIINGTVAEQKEHFIKMAAEIGYVTKSFDDACNFIIKQTVNCGRYNVGIQVAEIYANKLSMSADAMVKLGEMYYRLERKEESVDAFRQALAREQALADPDPEKLKYYQEYLDWIIEKL